MNTPTDNAWLDKLLSAFEVIETDHLYHHEHDKDKLKQAIQAHIDTVCREAYKKGYIDKGIEDINEQV